MLQRILKLSGDSWFLRRNFVFFRRIAKKIATLQPNEIFLSEFLGERTSLAISPTRP
jgi:hypothetical protein